MSFGKSLNPSDLNILIYKVTLKGFVWIKWLQSPGHIAVTPKKKKKFLDLPSKLFIFNQIRTLWRQSIQIPLLIAFGGSAGILGCLWKQPIMLWILEAPKSTTEKH